MKMNLFSKTVLSKRTRYGYVNTDAHVMLNGYMVWEDPQARTVLNPSPNLCHSLNLEQPWHCRVQHFLLCCALLLLSIDSFSYLFLAFPSKHQISRIISNPQPINRVRWIRSLTFQRAADIHFFIFSLEKGQAGGRRTTLLFYFFFILNSGCFLHIVQCD